MCAAIFTPRVAFSASILVTCGFAYGCFALSMLTYVFNLHLACGHYACDSGLGVNSIDFVICDFCFQECRHSD